MAQLDCHFDNIASATTNSNSALEQLVTVTTNQCAEIKSPLDTLAKNLLNPVPKPRTRARSVVLPLSEKRKLKKHKLKKRIKPLEATVKTSWKVGRGHNSKTCGTRGAGHINSATQVNRGGLGKDKHKG